MNVLAEYAIPTVLQSDTLNEHTASYAGVVVLSTIKYFIAVVSGLAQNYSLPEVLLTAGVGGVVSSAAYIYFGRSIRAFLDRFPALSRRRSFSRRRRIVKIWRRYGLAGTAFIIPVISPQICIGVAISFREKPLRILTYVTASMLFWILVSYFLKSTVLQLMGFA